MINIDVVAFFTLTVRGFFDSFHGFLYVPIVIFEFIRDYFGRNRNDRAGDCESKIVEALKIACIYNFIFTVLMLPVVYLLLPLCSLILSKTLSGYFLYGINTVFYHFGLILRIIPIQVYKFGHFYLFQDIAKVVHIKKKGKPQEWAGFQVRVSDTIFNLVVQTIYGVQLIIVTLLIGCLSDFFPSTKIKFLYSDDIIQFIIINGLTSIWYSLCLFEYKWYFMAWNLHKRLGYIEKNWSYFISFSFLYSMITTHFDSYCLNALIAGMLFPFYLISAYEADPEENIGISSIPFFQPSVITTNFLIRKINKWSS